MERKKLFSVTLNDCRVDTFTVGGHGGSGKDTSNTGVRITHTASGAVGKATDTRKQHTNKQLAFRRMAETKAFRAWVRVEAARISGSPSLEELVEAELSKIKIEVYKDGKWVETK